MDIKNATYLIGIDPGVNTGFAVWVRPLQRFMMVETVSIVAAHNYLINHEEKEKLFIRIEDARKRKWFGKAGREQLQGAGSIKRDCQIWQEFLEYHKISYELVPPKNNKTKLNAAMFLKYTGWKQRTSVHARDAAMLVFQI